MIYLCLDNDAIQDSVKIAGTLMDEGIDVKVIRLPNDEDPSSIGFEKFLNYYSDSESLTFKQLMAYKLGI